MHIGILQCCHLDEEAGQMFGDITDMIMGAFLRTDHTLEFTVFDAIKDRLPPVDSCDAFLITGSTSSAYDNKPWIKTLENFIRTCDRVEKKLLGFCFGHQLIAQALGGKAGPCDRGWALGTGFYELSAQKDWMEPPLEKLDILVMHRDQVIQLPKGAEVIAYSQFCPYFLVQYNESILGIQGHPEFTESILRHLIEVNLDDFAPNKMREALISLSAPLDSEILVQWLLKFIQPEENID